MSIWKSVRTMFDSRDYWKFCRVSSLLLLGMALSLGALGVSEQDVKLWIVVLAVPMTALVAVVWGRCIITVSSDVTDEAPAVSVESAKIRPIVLSLPDIYAGVFVDRGGVLVSQRARALVNDYGEDGIRALWGVVAYGKSRSLLGFSEMLNSFEIGDVIIVQECWSAYGQLKRAQLLTPWKALARPETSDWTDIVNRVVDRRSWALSTWVNAVQLLSTVGVNLDTWPAYKQIRKRYRKRTGSRVYWSDANYLTHRKDKETRALDVIVNRMDALKCT